MNRQGSNTVRDCRAIRLVLPALMPVLDSLVSAQISPHRQYSGDREAAESL